MHHCLTKAIAVVAASAMAFLPVCPASAQGTDGSSTKTPIKHVVVIFQENVSFDHYFGTYPNAFNLQGETSFHAWEDTPRVNNLQSAGLLTSNPNSTQPFRLTPAQAVTCDQDHSYGDEQKAFHGGLMDLFPETVGVGTSPQNSCKDYGKGKGLVMGYYDGNTVTALWNYAQHFAMSDNSFGTTFGPSTPGLLNLVAGNTFEGTIMNGKSGKGNIAGGGSTGAVIGDPDPFGDVCSAPGRAQIAMSGQNIGELLNNAGVTWGSFMGGFANCVAKSTGLSGTTTDYIPHHAFFQYWQSTLNANHTPRTSVAMIGRQGDAANHEYDINDFWDAVKAHNMPAVSFLKARAIQDGHAGYSNPLDEQIFLVNTIDALEKTDEWKETAVIISYDDSDGWYDHVMGPNVNQSNISDDMLLGVAPTSNNCGTPKPIDASGTIQNGRCGYGPRLPLFVISPFAKRNYVDHSVTDQSSILRFIEDNWNLGRIGNGSTDAIAGTLNGMFDFDMDHRAPRLFLDPATGTILDE